MKSQIIVWFSCGAASAVAAKKTIELYPDANIRIVNNPVKEEHGDNRRFLLDVESWLERPIEIALNPNWPSASCVDVWQKRKFMSGVSGAPCTVELKKKARQHFELQNKIDFHVLGFTADEKKRAERFKLTERDNTLFPLIDCNLTKQDCFAVIQEAKIDLPAIYKHGFPNANCIGCVKATSPTYWNLVRKKFPDVFEQRKEQSEQIGARLVRVKGKRMFLKELDPNEQGQKLGSWDCGIFCEEKEI